MSIKVYGYVNDGGDGSYSIVWYKEKLEDQFDHLDRFSDGDGLSYRAVLTFESYEAAEAAGIRLESVDELREDEEDDEE